MNYNSLAKVQVKFYHIISHRKSFVNFIPFFNSQQRC